MEWHRPGKNDRRNERSRRGEDGTMQREMINKAYRTQWVWTCQMFSPGLNVKVASS